MLLHSGGKTAVPVEELTNNRERSVGQESLDRLPLTPQGPRKSFKTPLHLMIGMSGSLMISLHPILMSQH